MGDALCGPSNALQNFQKHTSVDRTLQQDRLTSRQPSAQGFRSQSPRDGILDPEFAAFEANLGGPQLQEFQHPAQLQHPAQFGGPAQLHHAQHPSANWASDFQNLNISGPSAPQIHTPPAAQNQRGWHNEFMNQHQQPAPAHHIQAQPMANRGFQSSFAPSYGMYNTSMNGQQMSHTPQQQHQAPVEQFDESAFEAAFDQARANLDELQQPEVAAENELPLHEISQADPGTVLPDLDDLRSDTARIGSDTIAQSDKQDPLTRAHDADALAQTAGQLLDSVRHEQNQKFQQSNFLALMRRIRDREVEVEGDEFRETAQSLHPGGPYYPGQPIPDQATPSDSTSKETSLPVGGI
ncbi:peroxin-20 Pex20-Penicillium chrysogenum [Penicillium manginii]|uniref:peroxin-20 Pex20-Penicillium chrysogenum n=1 Tax=Penicillium manginii TaxID=203109 RepID=UPI002546BBA2|nr:peroxin-20 Pex20-Penicillium chrysogenum [Penicillium manginii]KAJ5763340.1 peroxin-20 Pex20-Penicillium chrysogenum [Penicillium manginii]